MKRRVLTALASFPILPLLVAVILPLQLARTNPALFSGGIELARTMALCSMAALLVTLVLALLLRDLHRVNILATIVVALVVFGAPPAKAGAQFLRTELGLAVPPSLVLFAIIGAAALLLSRIRVPPIITQTSNYATLAVLVYNAVILSLAAYQAHIEVEERESRAANSSIQYFSNARAPRELPDIIHIVLDGYSRADVLTEVYRFDNSEFLADLESLGFKVASETVAPYNQTLLTMNSIFRGDYLESGGTSAVASATTYSNALATAFAANPVMSALRRMGYRIASTKSEYPPLVLGGTVMATPTHGWSMTFLERTLFEFSGVSLIIDDLGLSATVRSNSVVEIRSALEASRRERGVRPYFHYVHLMAPHPPFDVDADGRGITLIGVLDRLADGSHLHAHDPKEKMAYRDGYRRKLAFINSEITAFAATAIAERQGKLIILLHGDHGGGMHLDQNDVSATCMRERYLPLLAVYSSDGNLQKSLSPDTNLVNLYRIVFNTYFGTELAELPGRSSFASSKTPAIHIPVAPEALEEACLQSG